MLRNRKFSFPPIIIGALIIILILVIFRNWFSSSILSSGDWVYFFKQAISEAEFFSIWDSRFDGMGKSQIPTMWIHSYFTFTLKSAVLIPWQIFERVFWFFPFLLISIFSSIYLARRVSASSEFNLIAPLIFIFNTYSLLVIGGGQVGIALSYSVAPLILGIVLKSVELEKEKFSKRLVYSLILGLCISFQVLIDPRIFYVTFLSVVLFVLFNIFIKKLSISFLNLILIVLVPLLITLLLHAFWLIPMLIVRENPFDDLGPAYSSIEMVKFLSFAKIENSMSLLHPNWPENIFGKVSFQKPEFLLYPIQAFSSLFFAKKKDYLIFFFVLLSLIGLFLGKGANDPFGGIYLMLFDNFPGFRLFRDPSKWYLLTVISYSILIPFTISKIYFYLEKRRNLLNGFAGKLFLVIFSVLFFVSFIPFIVQEERGTYKKRHIPVEYEQLAASLSKDNNFYRTLWIPLRHRFGYNSEIHPAVSAEIFLNTADRKELLGLIKEESIRQEMIDSSIRYIVIPLDTDGEYFLNDRKYSEDEYKKTISYIEKIPGLERKDFGKIVLFDLGSSKPKFWCECGAEINFTKISNVKYLVNVEGANENDLLIFSEKFSNNWLFIQNGKSINSFNTNNLNSFSLPEGNSSIEVIYSPQKYVDVGIRITIITLLSLIILFLILFAKKLKK